MSKSSFMLYCDQQGMIAKLSNEQTGILFKEIYKYVCDPKLEPIFDDPITDMVFTAIKTALDRDKIKYEKVCQRNRDNGVKGGRPKSENNPKNPVG